MNQSCRTVEPRAPSTIAAEPEHADIRVNKVLTIRRQLREGTYHIDDRLDVVVERIMEELS